jgi:putative phosphoesterase
MRIAVLADIHGNFRALRAVLTDLSDHAPDLIVNLGDSLSGPLDAAETADLLMSLNIPTVRGNHDRHLVSTPSEALGPADRMTAAHLSEAHTQWLADAPTTAVVADDVFLCHGSPRSDTEYLTEDIVHGQLVLAAPAVVRDRIGDRAGDASLILCGHSHGARAAAVDDRLVVNPGSVGLQAYCAETPGPHVSENGNPYARYALLDRHRACWRVTFVAVKYDWLAAAAAAAAAGFDDWAFALTTGYAKAREMPPWASPNLPD